MQIAIATPDGRVSLWCSVESINEDGSINFWVLNGAWDGKYHNGQVYVEYTKALFPGMLVWVGSRDGNYNDVMRLIQDEVDDPEYVMTQPDQYVAPAKEVEDEEDEWDDDIPF